MVITMDNRVEQPLQFVFVSNYLNHHQIPFCDAMYRLLEGSFAFVQTERVEEERIRMGWRENNEKPYLKLYYEEPEQCRRLIEQCGIVLFGGSDDETYIRGRLEQGRPLLRYSERLYKGGQWKAVSPRGLLRKYKDHTRYRNKPIYLLCAGAYVPSDFHIVRAYPGKMLKWGYFPETRHYDVEQLLAQKGWRRGEPDRDGRTENGTAYLLWAARMIDWKHPELALRTAAYLKEKGCDFHMDMVGGGAMEEQISRERDRLHLQEYVTLCGYCPPGEVRRRMEQADIFLATSDRGEGWGAVINEAMNSGCAVVGDHMMGAVPYLICHGQNGMIYEDGREDSLFTMTEELVQNRAYRQRLARAAVKTITEEWNGENAAARLLAFCREQGLLALQEGQGGNRAEAQPQDRDGDELFAQGPCSPAPVVSERKMYGLLSGGKAL